MDITPQRLRAALDRAFPDRAGAVFFPAEAEVGDEPHALCAEMALCLRDADGTVRDVKCQWVPVVRASERGAGERLDAYLAGWARALQRALAAGADEDGLLPCDLVFPELLADPTLTDAAAFAAAVLDPTRLGTLGTPAWAERAFRAHMDELGLGAHADELAGYLCDSLRLHPGDPEDVPAPGASRLGGAPDVADDFAWPRFRGASMAFIAQLDLAAVAAALPDTPLPRSGLLYFFHDAEQSAAGFDPDDRGACRVLHEPRPLAALAPAFPPDDLPREARFPARPLAFARERTAPPLDSPHYDLLAGAPLDQAGLAPFAEFVACYGAHPDDPPVHRLLGHPEPVQGDMYSECQLVTHGLYCGDDRFAADPRVPALRAGARDWRLLLQVDSDDESAMMWGDAGRLYFWIRRQDLALARFDAAWVITQCH